MRKTDRTATAKWRNTRRRFLHQAQANGITHCPLCRIRLDYTTGKRPNSAVPDHIHHHALGGTDDFDNLRTICARCNASDGGKLGNAIRHQRPPQHVPNITF